MSNRLYLWLLVTAGLGGWINAVAAEEPTVSFSRDIRPILAGKCYQCHGPDADGRQADLRLDRRSDAIASRDEGAAIVPQHPEQSLILERILSSDADLRMPPAESKLTVSAKEIELIRRWIKQGAKYERHWAFEPIRSPALPQVKHQQWPQQPLDYFVLANLERRGMTGAAMADKSVLLRRIYLDLLGILPSVRETRQFLADTRPGAYERLVERVLASPRFGERWGRHWLDQARYADSHGYTNDNARVMWPYRNWVIDAFNADIPFDQFTIEQLAGDMLPEPTQSQLVATGFHRNTLINSEGGTKADQFRDEQVKDRVDTTGGVWLALTIGCAKCHTHKFDPITQEDYYKFYSFFNSTADRNSITPTIKAPTKQQAQELAALDQRLAELNRRLQPTDQLRQRQTAWEQKLIARAASENESADSFVWHTPKPSGKSVGGAVLKVQPDQSLLVSGKDVKSDEYQVTIRTPITKIRSVRLEALQDKSLPMQGPGRAANGNFVLSEFWFRTGDGQELRFNKAYADHSQPKYDVRGAIDNKASSGWAINGSPEGGANHPRVAWFVLPKPLVLEKDHALTFTLQFNQGKSPYNIGRLRISIASDIYVEKPSAALLARLAKIPRQERTASQQQKLTAAFFAEDPVLAPIQAEQKQVAANRDKLLAQVPASMILRELPKPRQAHVQVRGDFLRPAAKVISDVPSVLPRLPSTSSESPGWTRLDLARWLVRTDNPLTARVRVNRLWMRLFGRGLVETENDFGTQGTLPSHPQLLDWLANEFMRQQWSTKRIVRMLVLSATYRQSSRVSPQQLKADPSNRLLGRQNRIRVEAEIVRDVGLSAADLLSDIIGGPSVYPPQPPGVYAFTQRKKSWRTSAGANRFRRGMYTFFYRSAPYPMLATFDTPKFNQTCTRRDRSNTPLQSLTVANSVAMYELTQALACRVLNELPTGDIETRIRHLFTVCYSRQPQPAELKFISEYFAQQQARLKSEAKLAANMIRPLSAAIHYPADCPPAQAAAWTAVARVLVNLDEFITRE